MKKSVYSLVLMDDVVAQVDQLAYRMHTNRSNMINQILAEYCSMLTPEKRMRSTLEQLMELLDAGGFQSLVQPSATMLTVRSALKFKYNPSVRYRVELFRSERPEFGQLQVQLRTQNQELIYYLEQFEHIWAALEQKYLSEPSYSIENGRYLRNLRFNPLFDSQSGLMGQAIGNYVNAFDRALKLYFENIDYPRQALPQIEQEMRHYAAEPLII